MDAMQRIVYELARDAACYRPPEKFNPRPQGVIVDGSGSDLVLEFLRQDYRFKTRAEIVLALREKINEHRVEWGLIYLLRNKLIKRVEDPKRNARYGRYAAIRMEDENAEANAA